jgi:hypothetical protein
LAAERESGISKSAAQKGDRRGGDELGNGFRKRKERPNLKGAKAGEKQNKNLAIKKTCQY